MRQFTVRAVYGIYRASTLTGCYHDQLKVKVPPLRATTALRAGRGIDLPNLRPRH